MRPTPEYGEAVQLEAWSCVGSQSSGYEKITLVTLEGGDHLKVVSDIVENALNEKNVNVLFHSVNPYNKLFDFVYQDDNGDLHAFQVTFRNEHTANAVPDPGKEANLIPSMDAGE